MACLLYSFSIFTAQALYSAVWEIGSKAGFVSQLAQASRKWKAIQTIPAGTRGVTMALTLTSPRRDATLIVSPSLIPKAAASMGEISAVSSPSRSLSPTLRPVWVRVW